MEDRYMLLNRKTMSPRGSKVEEVYWNVKRTYATKEEAIEEARKLIESATVRADSLKVAEIVTEFKMEISISYAKPE